MTIARLIVDPPQGGAWNMAVDEALLLSAGQGATTLRFYGWSEPTLSLGYFQRYEERTGHFPSLDCTCVRRASGGGAILHDRELTYSFAAPADRRWGDDLRAIYAAFHESLVEWLSAGGIEASLCPGSSAGGERGNDPPFLCFQRRTQGDVLLAGHKICGSAQRRHRGAFLQHGSFILHTSGKAPEIQGVEEIAERVLDCSEFVHAWSSLVAQRMGLSWRPGELTAQERELARICSQDRYSSEAWTLRR